MQCTAECHRIVKKCVLWDARVRKYITKFKNALRTKNFSKNENMQIVFNELLEKKIIFCEIGARMVQNSCFHSEYLNVFVIFDDKTNNLINDKISIFSWITPKHLEIDMKIEQALSIKNPEDNKTKFSQIAKIYSSMSSCYDPKGKIGILLKTMTKIYKVCSPENGYEKIFPVFIYIIIKSNVTNPSVNCSIMRSYLCDNLPSCKKDCSHILSNFGNKSCVCSRELISNMDEVRYYITAYEAALKFIENLEFKQLKIDEDEYNFLLLNTAELLNYKKSIKKPTVYKTLKNAVNRYFRKYF